MLISFSTYFHLEKLRSVSFISFSIVLSKACVQISSRISHGRPKIAINKFIGDNPLTINTALTTMSAATTTTKRNKNYVYICKPVIK